MKPPGGFQRLFGGGMAKAAPARAAAPALAIRDLGVPSWAELRAQAGERRAELGLPAAAAADRPANPHDLVRAFGSDAPPRVKLYRDHAAWCPYCHKIWLFLETKQIPYEVEKINMRCYGDKPRSFLAKVPSGMLPVAEIDGRVVTESDRILFELEDLYKDRVPLVPTEPAAAERFARLLRLERELFGAWMQWLTSGWSDAANRANFEAVLAAVDQELFVTEGPWFCDDFSLVDIQFVPFLERMVASLLYYKGYNVRSVMWPGIVAWFEGLEGRAAYVGTKSDYYTHVHDLPPQLGGCAFNDRAEDFKRAIDGLDGTSWHLPLPPLAETVEPVTGLLAEEPERDRLEAAEKLLGNHEAVVRFAARGCGTPGPRPVAAPLADPTATPGTAHLPAVDLALRFVVLCLLAGEGEGVGPGFGLEFEPDGSGAGSDVVASAAYLRDRIGVPRDLKLPAARQLRAHLNYLIGRMTPAT